MRSPIPFSFPSIPKAHKLQAHHRKKISSPKNRNENPPKRRTPRMDANAAARSWKCSSVLLVYASVPLETPGKREMSIHGIPWPWQTMRMQSSCESHVHVHVHVQVSLSLLSLFPVLSSVNNLYPSPTLLLKMHTQKCNLMLTEHKPPSEINTSHAMQDDPRKKTDNGPKETPAKDETLTNWKRKESKDVERRWSCDLHMRLGGKCGRTKTQNR